MLLKKEGTSDWREVSQKEMEALIEKALGKDFDYTKKNAFEFKMRQRSDHMNKRKVNPKLVVKHTFSTREGNTTVMYGYCHYTKQVSRNGMSFTELLPKNSRDLDIMFDKKTKIVPANNLDRFIYILLYKQCENSPFSKTGRAYSFYDPVATSKKAIVSLKEEMAIKNGILSEYPEDRLVAILCRVAVTPTWHALRVELRSEQA